MSPGDSTVLFRALPIRPHLTPEHRRALKNFVRQASSRVGGGSSFTCLVTNDNQLRRLNREFLGHDYATDVLSFPALEKNGNLGELAISVERAQAQAREFGHSLLDEMQILILHGLLHLTGMDHEKDRGEMARAERKWRRELGLRSTLIARARQRRQK